MCPKYRHKTQQTQKGGELNPFNALFGVVSQPAPTIGCKNAADLEKRHENANICCWELLRLQIQTPIWHKRANEEVINEVKAGKVSV